MKIIAGEQTLETVVKEKCRCEKKASRAHSVDSSESSDCSEHDLHEVESCSHEDSARAAQAAPGRIVGA